MSVIKVIEVLAESPVSWEEATKLAVEKAAKTLHHVKSIYIKEHSATVQDGKITAYRINAKISFVLD